MDFCSGPGSVMCFRDIVGSVLCLAKTAPQKAKRSRTSVALATFDGPIHSRLLVVSHTSILRISIN